MTFLKILRNRMTWRHQYFVRSMGS